MGSSPESLAAFRNPRVSAIVVVLCVMSVFFFGKLLCPSTAAPPFYGSQEQVKALLKASSLTPDCRQSLKDTYGYICDTDASWNIRKAIMLEQAGRVVLDYAATRSTSHYFQTNFEPSLSCAGERRVGTDERLD